MIALAAMRRHFHFAEQRIHLGNIEHPPCPYRTVAGHGRCNMVDPFLQAQRLVKSTKLIGQIRDQGFHVARAEHRRRRPHQHRARSEPFHLQSEIRQFRRPRLEPVAGIFIQFDDFGHQKRLGRHGAALDRLAHPLQHKPLVRRMLVDDHQTVYGLGYDIGFGDLSAGDPERMAGPIGHRRGSLFRLAHQRCQILLPIKAGKSAGPFVHLCRRIGLLRDIGSALGRKNTALWIRSSRFPLPVRQRRFRRSLDRPKPAFVQRLAQPADDHPADHRRFAKTHFGLGRMDVYVDQFRRHFDEQCDHRVTIPRQHFGIGATHRTDQQPVLDRTAVDEQKLMIGNPAVIGRQARYAGQPNLFPLEIDSDTIGAEIAAGQRGNPFGTRFAALDCDCLAPLMLQCETDIGSRHRQSPDNVGAGGIFAARASEKFASGRDIAEKLLDPHLRTRRDRSRPLVGQLAMVDDPRPAIFASHAAFDRHPRDAGDRRKRFAAETHGGHQLDRFIRQFRGRVTFQRQRNVIAAHPATIVGDLNQVESALIETDVDLAGTGVDRIFDQLFQGTGRALDHLPGSYPIYQAIWKSSY